MKKLTKIFLIILTSLTFGVGIDNAKAKEYKVNDRVKISVTQGYYKQGGLGYYDSKQIAHTDWDYKMWDYVIDGEYIAYCLDATYDDSVKVDNKISSIYDPDQFANDAALYAILADGANSKNSTKEDRAATEIALRAFVEGVALDGWTDSDDMGNATLEVKFAANANIAIYDILPQYSASDIKKILSTLYNLKTRYQNISECNSLKNGDEISTCFRKIGNAVSDHYYRYNYYASYPTTSNSFVLKQRAYYFNLDKTTYNNETMNITTKARRLLKKGIDAVIAFSDSKNNNNNNNNNENEGKFDVQLKLKSSSNVDTNSETNETTEVKYFTFSMTNIKEENKVNNIRIECSNCAANKVTIEKTEYQNGDSWETLTPSVDLTKLVEQNGDVDIRVTIRKGTFDSENCEPVSMNIIYDVYGETSREFEMYKVQAVNGSDSYQRYLMVKLITTSPNNSGTSSAKQERKSPSYSIDTGCRKERCETNLTTPICSEDKNGIAKVEAPKDIKKCVIDNMDDATNEYRLADTNGGVNNDYCGTFCKEDYREISLNKALDNVNCGGYFKLQARIEGSKDCYRGSENTSDKSIDIEQYTKDIIQIQQDLINGRNKLLEAQAAKAGVCTPKYDEKGNQIDCISNIESSCTEHKKDENGNDTEECKTTTYTLEGSYSGITSIISDRSAGTVTYKTESKKYSYSSTKSEDDSTESEDDIPTQINKDITEAEKNLKTLTNKYDNIINQFDACTNNWGDSKFNFDPKVYWEYSQNFDNELDTTYNDLLSKEDRTLEPIENTRKDSDSLQACAGTTDNKLENCSTGWTSIDSVLVNRTYTKCDENGCERDIRKVSQARFIKQHFEVEQDYDTPTVYYQVASSGPLSGSITTYKDFQNPNVSLSPVHGLPLSGDVTGGGIFKLKIEDLGEFYESGEQGRLIDFEGDQETHSVAYAKGYNAEGNWSGEYVCHYYTDCRPKDCPDCKFVCVGDYCEWEDCPDCTFDCINCIYNLGDLQLNMKPVSTTKFNESAGREYGYNWNISTTLSSLSLVRDKAEETIKEIEENNTTIYDDTNRESDDSKLEFSIEMTPEIIENIREYNKEKDSVGGYNDSSLVCYKYEDENGIVHDNVFCYSTFIDEMIEKYGSNVYYKPSRGAASDRTDESVVNSGYWTPWSEYGKYDESVIGGPSWK